MISFSAADNTIPCHALRMIAVVRGTIGKNTKMLSESYTKSNCLSVEFGPSYKKERI